MSFRATSRVLLIDEDDRVLMFLQHGKHRDRPPRWITPGGGVDPGEDHRAAALREVREETGLELTEVGEPFDTEDFDPDQRWHAYTSGHWEWFAVRVGRFDPSRAGWTPEEVQDVVEHRWLSVDELGATGFDYEPADLPERIAAALRSLA